MSNPNKKKGFYNANGSQQKKQIMNIQLINKNNVLISGPYAIFTENLKQTIKACKGQFVKDDNGWIVPRMYLETIYAHITNEKLDIPINKIPSFVDKIFTPFNGLLNFKIKTATTKIEYDASDKLKQVSDLPENFVQKLYAFQKKGVEFGIKNFGRALIADEMGVGKTIQALALASVYKSEWPFIIIAPSSLRLTWRDEIFKWMDDIRESEIQVIAKSNVDIKANIKALIISYDLASKMCDTIEDYKFQMAIVDEAHYIKNAEAKRTENLLPILKKCKRCILLTGTPAFARPKELFNILNILRPDVFTTFKDFGNRYCEPRPNKFSGGLDYNGAVNMKELHYLLMGNIMIRRLKKDVLAELPPKRRQKVVVKTDGPYVKKIQDAISKAKGGQMSTMVDGMMDNYFSANEDNFESEVNRVEDEERSKHPEVLQCYLYTGLAKLSGVREYLHDLMQNDIKLLVFAHHTEVLNGIEEEVNKMKMRYIRIDGSTEVNKRYENVKLFQEDEGVKIGILSLTAAGIGLTLTAASTCVFAEMYWTPAVMLQAEDRIHRMGQKNKTCVNYHYLYGEGTLDTLLYEKLQTKLAVVSEILEGKAEYLEVEEEKKESTDSNAAPQPAGKRRKDGYGKEKNSSSLGGANDKSTKGMAQITSYFQKKPLQTNDSKASEQLNFDSLGGSEMKPMSESKDELTRVDSLDWDDVDRMLEEDQAKRQAEKQNSIEKNKPSFPQRPDIAKFDQSSKDEESKGLEREELERFDEMKKKSKGEQEEFGKSVFYKCLEEIFENEKSNTKEKDDNNKDIRSFFDKGTDNNNKKKVEEKKDKHPLINGSFFVWKKKDEKEASGEKSNENSLRESDRRTTPVKSNSGSVAKGNSGSNMKNKFRFSLQPTHDSANSLKSTDGLSEESGKRSEKKRMRDLIELSDEEGEKEITSHILKKVKENQD